jgi:hypothetical protein
MRIKSRCCTGGEFPKFQKDSDLTEPLSNRTGKSR